MHGYKQLGLREPLNKSIQDLPEGGKTKTKFPFPAQRQRPADVAFGDTSLCRKEGLTIRPSLDIGETQENPAFLQSQIITYIGNKRRLLHFLGRGFSYAQTILKKEKLSFFDAFSGSGIVARYAKRFSSRMFVNDMEDYSRVINQCYLSNQSCVDMERLSDAKQDLNKYVKNNWREGFIAKNYSPKNENAVRHGERVFYTRRNAIFIDTARRAIDELDEELKHFFLAPLLVGASVHANTSGVFKGFYKDGRGVGKLGGAGENALRRITAPIQLRLPVFSNFEYACNVLQGDANSIIADVPRVDLAYFDPPYNQHPYGSNYFMLNLILSCKEPTGISGVSGIPNDWNRSAYNKKQKAEAALFDLIANCKAKTILISYNSEGFIPHKTFLDKLSENGRLKVLDQKYNTFRACRNLHARDTHVTEFLYLLDKRGRYGKHDLRKQRTGTVINKKSKNQETKLIKALMRTEMMIST